MADATISFNQPQSGAIREAPLGFFWTVLLFGFFPPLFRNHWAGFLILGIITFFTSGLSNIVFAFIYNRMYIKHLIGEGFKVQSSSMDINYLAKRLNLNLH